MADSKSYRPKVDAGEGFSLTANFPMHEPLNIGPDDWPYETEDGTHQAFLDSHDSVTDRPLPKAQKKEQNQSSGNADKNKEA